MARSRMTTAEYTAKHTVNVTYVCEHCGAAGGFSREIRAKAVKSYQGKLTEIPAIERDLIKSLARTKLQHKTEKYRLKADAGDHTWMRAEKCAECAHFQSWQSGRIWRDFAVAVAIWPLTVALALTLLAFLIFGMRPDWPEWLPYAVGLAALAVAAYFLVILVASLLRISTRGRNKPSLDI